MSEMRDKQNNAAVPSNMQQDGARIEVESDKPISTTRMQQLVDALTASDVTGELLFVGQPDQGPGLVVQCWKVTLSLSGEVGLISEELASIPMTGEVLADDLNHPESPFFRVRYLG